jgi:bifunctional DNase/RNase
MEKIKLEIVGLSYSQTQTGAYALVLGEEKGQRRLPIIIGGSEAQAIAIQLEKMTPTRPLTHDLFKAFADNFEIKVREIVIYNLVEGIFYAKLVCDNGQKEVEIDTRTSDAIAIAVRFECPIFTYEFILSSSGIVLEEDVVGDENIDHIELEVPELSDKELMEAKSKQDLEKELNEALSSEDYEGASKLRDELNRRK